MISIIICSRDAKALATVSKSVEETIGVAYEIIGIDNSTGTYSICEAYNLGAAQSKFDYLCFMHEDLVLHTQNWGLKVLEHLSDVSIGLIGLAGAIYKSRSNSTWWGVSEHYIRARFIQSNKFGEKLKDINDNPNNELIADVVTLDGLWLCTRKQVWEKHKFDQERFKSFHFYDLDLSLQIGQNFRLSVVYDVLVEHLSEGSINKSWIENSIIFHNKWRKVLPRAVRPLPEGETQPIELWTAKDFIKQLKAYKFDTAIILRCQLEYLNLLSFRDKLWLLRNYIFGATLSSKIGTFKDKYKFGAFKSNS